MLLEKALLVTDRVPPAPPQAQSANPGAGEEPAWKNCWNWNLCDATFGHLILDIKDGRVSSEMKSQGTYSSAQLACRMLIHGRQASTTRTVGMPRPTPQHQPERLQVLSTRRYRHRTLPTTLPGKLRPLLLPQQVNSQPIDQSPTPHNRGLAPPRAARSLGRTLNYPPVRQRARPPSLTVPVTHQLRPTRRHPRRRQRRIENVKAEIRSISRSSRASRAQEPVPSRGLTLYRQPLERTRPPRWLLR